MIKFHPTLPAVIKSGKFWLLVAGGLSTLGTQLIHEIHKELCFLAAFFTGTFGASIQSQTTEEKKPEEK